MSDKYTLIFEDKNGNAETIEIQYIFLVFDIIKLNLQRIKKNDLKITLIDNGSSECLSNPQNTNILIQMVEDYYEFVDDKLALKKPLKDDEVIAFNTGNSYWVDTNIFEALKRPTDKTTKIFVVKKKDLIEMSNRHTSLGIYILNDNKSKQL